MTGSDLEEDFDHHSRDHAGPNGRPSALRDVAVPLHRSRLREERHQGCDDEDRLKPLTQHQHERLHEQVGGGAPVRDQSLRALEAGEEARVDGIELLGSRPGGGARPQRGERVLELAREGRIPGADLSLHLLEGEVGVERQLARPERHRGIDLAPCRREGRRCG